MNDSIKCECCERDRARERDGERENESVKERNWEREKEREGEIKRFHILIFAWINSEV